MKETIAEIRELALSRNDQFSELLSIVNKLFDLVDRINDMFEYEKARGDLLQAKLERLEQRMNGESWKYGYED